MPQLRDFNLYNRKRHAPGTSPGVLMDKTASAEPLHVDMYIYDEAGLQHVLNPEDKEIKAALENKKKVWLNVVGSSDLERIQQIADHANIHPLGLEDIVNKGQRPKIEEFGDHLIFYLRIPHKVENSINLEQISLYYQKGLLITFQEMPEDVFGMIRKRLENQSGRLRTRGSDYLLYALIDAIVDSYFPLFDDVSDDMDELEDLVLKDPNEALLKQVHSTKRELLTLKRVIAPQRDAVNSAIRDHASFFNKETVVYLRDCSDHLIRLHDILESLRERSGALIDMYMNVVSHRMNEIMKLLTLVATIFMPLGFLAGIYGMNFDQASPYNLPELSYRYGYPILIGVMLTIGLGLLGYFYRKGWLKSTRLSADD